MSRVCIAPLLLLFLIVFPCRTRLSAQAPSADRELKVLARTGAQSVLTEDLDYFLGRNGEEDLGEIPDSTLQNAIHVLALQRQALQTLQSQGLAVPDKAIDLWIRSAKPAETQKSVEEITVELCRPTGIAAEKLREHIQFRLSWARYLEKHLTEENLQKHFDRQKARFDGTRFKIDLVSIPVPAGRSSQRSAAHERLAKLRSSFPQSEQPAATEYDISREKWVSGTGDVHPSIVDSLLECPPGGFSEPIDTATNVHLVRQLERTEGQLPLAKVSADVRAHMLIYLLEHLAQQSEARLPLIAEPQ